MHAAEQPGSDNQDGDEAPDSVDGGVLAGVAEGKRNGNRQRPEGTGEEANRAAGELVQAEHLAFATVRSEARHEGAA